MSSVWVSLSCFKVLYQQSSELVSGGEWQTTPGCRTGNSVLGCWPGKPSQCAPPHLAAVEGGLGLRGSESLLPTDTPLPMLGARANAAGRQAQSPSPPRPGLAWTLEGAEGKGSQHGGQGGGTPSRPQCRVLPGEASAYGNRLRVSQGTWGSTRSPRWGHPEPPRADGAC